MAPLRGSSSSRIILPAHPTSAGGDFHHQPVISFYNEVLLATILLSETEQYTYAVGLSLFTTSDYTAKWGLIGAAAVVGALPIVLLFLSLQNQIVGGLTAGAVKG